MSSDLVKSGIEHRTLTFFALGGSGVRAVEPLLHMCAFGLGPRRLKLVFIDPDQNNAAVTRSRDLIELYRRTRDAAGVSVDPEGFFRTEVLDTVSHTLVWSPIADDRNAADARFSARVDRARMDGRRAGALGQLFDLLFSERIREMDLNLGFRGIPSIGTVFMNRLREEPFFQQLLTDAQSEPDSVFFAVGSVFGGTGASGLPVVGRALVDPIRGAGEHRTDIAGVPATRVSAALLLPYFTLPTPNQKDADDGGPRPETALFIQNAIGALPTYVGRQAGFGSCYVIGDSEPREQATNAVGGEAQANAPHYVELYAALAALDFAARGGEDRNSQLPAFYATAVERSNVSWSDLPMTEESRRRLMGGFIAAHTFLTLFRPNGGSQPGLEGRLKGVTWMDMLGLRPAELRDHSAALDALGEYYSRSWRWLSELRRSSPALELVRADGRKPLEVGLQETIEGRRGVKTRKTTRDGHEIFRYWNRASLGRAGKGYAGFLEVMREGSEQFAVDQFAEAIKPAENA